jgi:hypothetical protein
MPEVVIDNFPQTITKDSFNVTVTIKGAKNGTNYLRVEVYNGETFNGKDWYGGADGKEYFPIEINSASTSATVQGRVINPVNGNYKLKIKRYTASGNAANDTENSVDVQIEIKKEMPTAEPTGFLNVEVDPTVDPTILPTSDDRGVVQYALTPVPTPEILAYKTQNDVKPIENNNFPMFPALIFVIGLFCIGIAIYKVYTVTNVAGSKKNP